MCLNRYFFDFAPECCDNLSAGREQIGIISLFRHTGGSRAAG